MSLFFTSCEIFSLIGPVFNTFNNLLTNGFNLLIKQYRLEKYKINKLLNDLKKLPKNLSIELIENFHIQITNELNKFEEIEANRKRSKETIEHIFTSQI